MADKKPGPKGEPLPGETEQEALNLGSTTDAAPAAGTPIAEAPANEFGIAEPVGGSQDDYLRYEEEIFKAKEKRDSEAAAEKKKTDDEAAAAAAKAKPAEAKPAAKTDAKPGEKPAATAAAETKPASEKPIDELDPPARTGAATEYKPLPADDTFALAEGVEWKRGDIIANINNGSLWKQEAERFRNLFGRNGEETEKAWGAWLGELKEHPNLAAEYDQAKRDYFEGLEDPEYSAFMQGNRERWRAWKGTAEGQAATPARKDAPPGVDPQIASRIETLERELASERATKSSDALRTTIRAEETRLKTQYGFLGDPDIWNFVWRTTVQTGQEQAAKNNGVSNYTLTDAVRDHWTLITRMAKARTDGQTAGAQVETPVALRSSGAGAGTETAARGGRTEPQEEVFANADEAAAAWARKYPNGYTGE